MDLCHGPSLRAVRSQPRELAHRCNARRGVGDDPTESQRLLVAVPVVRLGGARQGRDRLLARVGRADECSSNLGRDIAGQCVGDAGSLTRWLRTWSDSTLAWLPSRRWFGRSRATLRVAEFMSRARDVDRALSGDASPSFCSSVLAGLDTLALFRSQWRRCPRGRAARSRFARGWRAAAAPRRRIRSATRTPFVACATNQTIASFAAGCASSARAITGTAGT